MGLFCSVYSCLFGECLRDCGVYQQGTPHGKAPFPALTGGFCSCLQEGDAFVNVQDGILGCSPVGWLAHAVEEQPQVVSSVFSTRPTLHLLPTQCTRVRSADSRRAWHSFRGDFQGKCLGIFSFPSQGLAEPVPLNRGVTDQNT